ncbi:MAG: hypothetical protein HC892_01510 [Saprospiraceae bacterium]|nr:hypothetical protein [Saprospiraceae bacterium]
MAFGFGNNGGVSGGSTPVPFGGIFPNYSALPLATSFLNKLFYVKNSQGTQWLPGSLGGTYYPSGWYYSDGISYTYQTTAFQATQITVDGGINNDQFVTPLTLQNAAQRKLLNCGVVTDVTITDKGNGLIDISGIEVHFNTESDFSGLVNRYTVPSLLNVQLNANQYIYVVANYNNGVPIYQLTTDNSIVNHSTILNVVQLNWETLNSVNELHVFKTGKYGLGLANKTGHRLIHTERFGYQEGLQISEYGTRNIRIESGIVWYDGEEIMTNLVTTATAGHEFHFYYPVASVWNVQKIMQYPNSQYSDGANLVSLSGNKLSALFVFKSINTDDFCSYGVLGNQFNSVAEALESSLPIIPELVQKQSKFIGRIIFQNGASTASRITREVTSNVSSVPVTNHNDTANRDVAGTHTRIYPISNNATAFQILRQDGTTVMVNVDTLNRLLEIGDIANGNYSMFESNGVYAAKGSAITWKDEMPSYLLNVSGAASPDSVSHNVGGVLRQFDAFDGGGTEERKSGSFEISHEMVVDEAMKLLGYLPELHIHWRPSTAGTGVLKMFFDWEYSPPQGDPIPQTTLTFLDTIATPQQYRHKLTSFGKLPNLNFQVGGKIGFNIRRTPNDPQDTYGSDILLEQIALHIPCDTNGSRDVYIK